MRRVSCLQTVFGMQLGGHQDGVFDARGLANRKVALAAKHKAVLIREHLTIMAKEKAKPGYFGRTFNKMMNNGSKGQHVRASSAKLKWSGIPEVTVPSYYTSSTDIRFGVVDKAQRKTQDRFKASTDGREMQADIHAACTIGLYALLRPMS
jgi:transposase